MENSTPQLGKEQAVALYESKIWEQWDFEKRARLQLFQKKLFMPFDKFKEALEFVLGRPVYLHEFAYADELIKEFLGAKPAPTLNEILEMIPEDKRVITVKG